MILQSRVLRFLDERAVWYFGPFATDAILVVLIAWLVGSALGVVNTLLFIKAALTFSIILMLTCVEVLVAITRPLALSLYRVLGDTAAILVIPWDINVYYIGETLRFMLLTMDETNSSVLGRDVTTDTGRPSAAEWHAEFDAYVRPSHNCYWRR